MSKDYKIVTYRPQWTELYDMEARKIKTISENDAVPIEHIGSTAIPGLAAKPIIDIAILISSISNADKYFRPLSKLGYKYDQQESSSERHFFRKYGSVQYHLSIAYNDKGSYWKRQIVFRDYLRNHDGARVEYETIKLQLIKKDPTGRHSYTQGKGAFIQRILRLAERGA